MSIIIPVLNEETLIEGLLRNLRLRFAAAELVVVDGGSTDQTFQRAAALADKLIQAEPGRAIQMNAGAMAASGRVLLFLHADTHLPDDALEAVTAGLAASGFVWGRFDVTLDGEHPFLPVIAGLMNLRSRLTGVATGDQAIFVTRKAFATANGFPKIVLMEDVALSKRLRRITAPLCLRAKVSTSGRRWEANGVMRTILIMWALRLGYILGVPPSRLAQGWGWLKRR